MENCVETIRKENLCQWKDSSIYFVLFAEPEFSVSFSIGYWRQGNEQWIHFVAIFSFSLLFRFSLTFLSDYRSGAFSFALFLYILVFLLGKCENRTQWWCCCFCCCIHSLPTSLKIDSSFIHKITQFLHKIYLRLPHYIFYWRVCVCVTVYRMSTIRVCIDVRSSTNEIAFCPFKIQIQPWKNIFAVHILHSRQHSRQQYTYIFC